MTNVHGTLIALVLGLIVLTESAEAANRKSGLEVHSSMNVHFLIVDPIGRMTGYDGQANIGFQTVPSSIYDTLLIGDIDTTQPNIISRECLLGFGADSMLNGSYTIKVVCLQAGNFWLDITIVRVPQFIQQSVDRVGSTGQVFLYRFTYNYNTSIPITLDTLATTREVQGGIVNPSGSSILSVRAKPAVIFGTLDTLVSATATIRWQSRYSLTLGTVSSPTYGFSKYGTVTTIGPYNYQQFRTTTHVPLNWTANTEYELFTVPVNGCAGVEEFTLTNALSGGQWSVDIDYLDKTDSIFYQPVATCTGR
jgi:hypothetical protein